MKDIKLDNILWQANHIIRGFIGGGFGIIDFYDNFPGMMFRVNVRDILRKSKYSIYIREFKEKLNEDEALKGVELIVEGFGIKVKNLVPGTGHIIKHNKYYILKNTYSEDYSYTEDKNNAEIFY